MKYSKLKKLTIYSIILFMIMVAFMLITTKEVSASTNAIKTQQEAVNWLKSQNGNKYDFDGVDGTQCVEFVRAYVNFLLKGNPWTDAWNGIHPGNGREVYNSAMWKKLGWDVYKNTADFLPQPGDIFSAGGKTKYGHTAVVISSTLTKATIMEANFDGNGCPAKARDITWRSASSNTAEGATYFIRPKFASKSTAPKYSYTNISGSYYLKNSNNNRYLTVDGLANADKANISTAVYSSAKQKVAIEHIGSNNHTLIPACTSRLVNAWSNNPAHNSNVNLYHRDNSNLSSQAWKFEKSGAGYIIHLAYNENLCLTQVNNNVVVQNRTGAANQIWILEANVVTKGCSHTYDSGKVTKKATTSANGVRTYTCTKCKATKTATIYKANKISLSKTAYTYNGKAQKPTAIVKDSNGKTISNKNYTVSYANNQNPGKATAKITFKNEYSGTINKTFDIKIAATSGAKIKTQSTKGITLQWNKVSAVTGYEVYMATSKNGSYKKIATIGKNSTTTYTKNGLATGKTYYFRIRAYKTIGKKKHYGSYATTVGTTKTSAPKIKSATAGSKQATVKWNKVSAATGYEVYMATSKNGKYTKIATITKNSTISYRKKGLTKRKTYYFKVRTYRKVNGKNVYSAMSNIKAVKVK